MGTGARQIRRFGDRELFNLPLSESYLVLDLRQRSTYEGGHLIGAWHAAGLDEETLDAVLRDVDDEHPPEQLSTVVVCAEPGEGDAAAELLATLAEPETEADASSLGSRLARRLETVGVFESTAAFGARYPFLAVSGPEPTRHPAPVLPALLEAGTPESGGLYLGSQAHALSPEVFHLLDIGAVVNATEEVPFLEDLDAARAPARLRCPLRDDDRQDLETAFEASRDFLADHRGRGVACLVHCSRGRNRSAALAANHLLHWHSRVRVPSDASQPTDATPATPVLTPADAVRLLRECRPGALDNPHFTAQLARLPAPGGGALAAPPSQD